MWLLDDAGRELSVKAVDDKSGMVRMIRIPADRGIVGEALTQRRTVNVVDAYEHARFDRSVDARTGFRTRSVLAVPMLHPDR